MDNDDFDCKASWKAFWCSVVILAAVWEVYDYYGEHYCKNTAIPVLCSKD